MSKNNMNKGPITKPQFVKFADQFFNEDINAALFFEMFDLVQIDYLGKRKTTQHTHTHTHTHTHYKYIHTTHDTAYQITSQRRIATHQIIVSLAHK